MKKLLLGSVAFVALIAANAASAADIRSDGVNAQAGTTDRFDLLETMWIVHAGVKYKFSG